MIYDINGIKELQETLKEVEVTRAIALRSILEARGISISVEDAKKILNDTADRVEELNSNDRLSARIH